MRSNSIFKIAAVIMFVAYITAFNYGGCGGGGSTGSSGIPIPQPAPVPDQVTSPVPADNAANVPFPQQLSWASAAGADSYDVYFGLTCTGWTAVTNTTTTGYNPGPLSYNTAYYWRIDAINAVGTTAGQAWSFQTVANQAPTLAAIGDKIVSEASLLTFAICATDPEGASLAYSASGLPAGAAFITSTGTFSWTPNFTQANSYNATFRATDADGLFDEESITITVNNLNRAPVLTSPGDRTVNENALLSLTLSAADPDSDTIVYSMVSTPTGAAFVAGVFTWTPDYTQAGSYPVTFTATANGQSDSKAITITVNNVNRAPTLNAIGNQIINEDSLLTFIILAIDPDSDALTYSATGLPAGAAFDAGTRTFFWTPGYTQTGNYNVTFRVADADGLFTEEIITISVGDVNRPPVLSAIGNRAVAENQLLTFIISGTDPDPDVLTYSASGLPAGATFVTGTGTFSWTPDYTQANNYNIIFTVTDNGTGNMADSETITITVNNTDRAPVLTSPGPQAVNENANLTFPLSATDPDAGDTITYSMAGTTTGATLIAGTFSWTPDYTQADVYTVVFTATSNALTNSKTIIIAVNNVDRAPVLTSPGPQAVNENVNLTFPLSATDPDSDTIAYSMAGTATGATLIAGTFSWTPGYTQADVYTVVFTATSNALADSKTIVITVNNVDRPPELTSPNNQSINEYQPLTITLVAIDPDGDPVNYSMVSTPTGAAFIAGVFTWTPDYTQSGAYPVTFTATANGLTDSEAITITVNDALEISNRGGGNWQYYRPITITNSASVLTDCQVTVIPFNDQAVSDTWLYNAGLVGSWHFSEGIGQSLLDMSGNGNNGQLGSTSGADASDPSWTAGGRFGNALTFDGVDDYVSVANEPPFDLTAQVTVESWVKLSASQSASTMWGIAAKGYDGIFPYALIHTNNTGIDGAKYGFAFGGVTGGLWKLAGSTDSGSLAAVGQWYYVVGTYDGAKFNIYVNGAFVASSDNTTIALNNIPVSIGAFYENGPPKYFLNGAIDEVRIYNRALSAAEIAARYNSNAPKVKGDCADIRFTNSDATQEYGYWQETDNRFRVKLPTLPTGDSMLRMYYGNVSATDSGSLANVYGASIVGFWPFNEGAGATTYDRSGNAGHGTLYNSPTWTAGGRFGNALSFDGTNDYLTTVSNTGISGTSPRTTEFWAKMNANPSSGLGFSLVYFGTTASNLLYAATVTRPGGGLSANKTLFFGGYSNDLLGVATLELSTWYHFAITYDGTTLKMYVNGVLDNSVAKTLNTANNVTVMGYPPAGDWSYYNGLIDETRIYNRVLTAAEIASRYVAPANDPSASAPGAEQ
ncbi:MAG: DUF2341 domain-containing protein [Planctomycetota bacterium]